MVWLERSHVSTRHVDTTYFYVSLIYGEYRRLANVHFCEILHTFIPHFTFYYTEKFCIAFSANYPFTTFHMPHSAKYFPRRTHDGTLARGIVQATGQTMKHV